MVLNKLTALTNSPKEQEKAFSHAYDGQDKDESVISETNVTHAHVEGQTGMGLTSLKEEDEDEIDFGDLYHADEQAQEYLRDSRRSLGGLSNGIGTPPLPSTGGGDEGVGDDAIMMTTNPLASLSGTRVDDDSTTDDDVGPSLELGDLYSADEEREENMRRDSYNPLAVGASIANALSDVNPLASSPSALPPVQEEREAEMGAEDAVPSADTDADTGTSAGAGGAAGSNDAEEDNELFRGVPDRDE